MSKKSPKLRTVNKSLPPYPLNEFGSEFPYILGREIVYLLASKGKGVLEGSEWEEIFAHCIGADWKPSNVGLDDVVLGNTAWGAKTVKSGVKDFRNLNKVRLISGRNSIVYSYGGTIDTVRYDPELFEFSWNKNENLEGFDKGTGNKRFVWQPHGSQFTIIEEVPTSSLILKLKPPKALNKDKILEAIGFDKTWVTIEKRK